MPLTLDDFTDKLTGLVPWDEKFTPSGRDPDCIIYRHVIIKQQI